MTLQERLNRRLDLLIDLGALTDAQNDMMYFIPNRRLDCSLTWVKYLSKPRFSKLLEECQEAFINFNKKKT